MNLEIITPDKQIFSGEVETATFPGSKGAFQVLENHAALVSTLTRGVVKYRVNNNEQTLKVDGGVVEVLNNRITVLVEHVLDGSRS